MDTAHRYKGGGPEPAPGHWVGIQLGPGSWNRVHLEGTVQAITHGWRATVTEHMDGAGWSHVIPVDKIEYLATSWTAYQQSLTLSPLAYSWLPEVTRQTVTATTAIIVDLDEGGSVTVGEVTAIYALAPMGIYGGAAIAIDAESRYSIYDRSSPHAQPTARANPYGETCRFWPVPPTDSIEDHVDAFRAAIEWVRTRYITQNEIERRDHAARTGEGM